jgi:hypothetical protein
MLKFNYFIGTPIKNIEIIDFVCSKWYNINIRIRNFLRKRRKL